MMASKVNVDTRVRVNNTHVEQNDTALTVCFSRYLEQVRRWWYRWCRVGFRRPPHCVVYGYSKNEEGVTREEC